MPTTPSLAQVITEGIKAHTDELMTATVGKVVTYNPLTDTVDVLPMVLRPLNEEGEVVHEQLPVLPSVPIAWPRAGGYILHLPILPGDHVLLVFTHDNIAMWRETGAQSVPGDLRRHSLANAVAYPGIAPVLPPLSIDPTHAAARLAGAYLGKEGSDQVIEFSELGIGLGHLAVNPVAMAPGVLTALGAIAAWIAAINTYFLGPGAGPVIGATIAAHPPFVAATGAVVAAMTAAAVPGTGIPATLSRTK